MKTHSERHLQQFVWTLVRILVITVSCAWGYVLPMIAAADEPSPKDDNPFARWEQDIAAFERADEQTPPPQGAIVFVGSSSIRLWDLKESFPEETVINRGFGGSQIIDSVHFADRIVLKYKPRTIVLYAGDNDIAAGKTPKHVAKDFQLFARTVHAELPEARILFVSIKPSVARRSLMESMQQANKLIAAISERDERLVYVDIFTPMLDDEGEPRADLLADDGLHLNRDGYQLWASRVKPILKADSTKGDSTESP